MSTNVKEYPKIKDTNTDFEVRSLDAVCVNQSEEDQPGWHLLKYLVAGVFFGIILVKSEVISWFRIQEMFRLQSFHMFGVIGSAVVVGMISIQLIKKQHMGNPLCCQRKNLIRARFLAD
jgi:intracellular septation protein A